MGTKEISHNVLASILVPVVNTSMDDPEFIAKFSPACTETEERRCVFIVPGSHLRG